MPTQTGLVKQKFVEAIQNYQTVEQQYRTKYKQRLERQFKIGTLQFHSIAVEATAEVRKHGICRLLTCHNSET